MARAVTLFTGQWADLSLSDLAPLAASWGYDGLELACWGDHFDAARAITDPSYRSELRSRLDALGLKCWTLGAHLIGQAVCDPIDSRHRAILPPEVWGDGDPAGVQGRAAERLMDIARAAALMEIDVVTGFTGSPIWRLLYSFPPNDFAEIEQGYVEFAERFSPILDVFAREGVRFALEVHPTEIAYDFETTARTLDAIGRHPSFGINLDPSHFVHQFLDADVFVAEYADRIFHVHVKDCVRRLNGRRSILGSHLDFGSAERGWEFVSPGHGDVDFESLIRALNRIGYEGPLSVEWEDSGMDREWGAREAVQFVRRIDFPTASAGFDSAFSQTR